MSTKVKEIASKLAMLRLSFTWYINVRAALQAKLGAVVQYSQSDTVCLILHQNGGQCTAWPLLYFDHKMTKTSCLQSPNTPVTHER